MYRDTKAKPKRSTLNNTKPKQLPYSKSTLTASAALFHSFCPRRLACPSCHVLCRAQSGAADTGEKQNVAERHKQQQPLTQPVV